MSIAIGGWLLVLFSGTPTIANIPHAHIVRGFDTASECEKARNQNAAMRCVPALATVSR